MKLPLESLMTINHQKPYVLQNEVLPFSSLSWFGFVSFLFFGVSLVFFLTKMTSVKQKLVPRR